MNSSELVDQSGLPVVSGGGEQDAMRSWAQELVSRARGEGVALTGDEGLLTSMVREVLQAGLEVEMVEHLGYEAYDPTGRGSGNSRNGTYAKTVKTDVGPVDLRVPRDREGTFAPVTVPKHVRRLEGFGANVISLYAKGLTTGRSRRIWLRSTTPRSPARRSPRSPMRSSMTWSPGSHARWIVSTRCC